LEDKKEAPAEVDSKEGDSKTKEKDRDLAIVVLVRGIKRSCTPSLALRK